MASAGIWYPHAWPDPEIAYNLARAYWGKGYASEAAGAEKNMAVEALPELKRQHPLATGYPGTRGKTGKRDHL